MSGRVQEWAITGWEMNRRPAARHSLLGPWECLCLAVFLALTGWQLFVFPPTGLSDNNDFAKVLGPAHICRDPISNLNTWFVTSYDAGPQCAWPSGFVSTEILFLDLARILGRPFTGRYHFDIRASAAMHLAILALATALFLTVTRRRRPWIRLLLPPLAIFMFTDVAYVAYLNSAYMDNASWVLYLLLVAIAAAAIAGANPLRATPAWTAPAYAITGILLVFSKAQHAVLGLPFAGLAAYFAWRGRTPIERARWSIGALALLAAAVLMPNLTPSEYRTISLYNLVFYRLAPAHPAILDQLGLDARYRPRIGTEAFSPGSPVQDPDWAAAFHSHVSFGAVALLYLRHPAIAFHELDRELHDSVHSMRPDYMANYRQADGFAPHTIATRFSLWSRTRVRLLTTFPYFLVALYSLPLVAVAARSRARFLPLALTLMVAGVGEFAICTLADAVDTHRHLFLFHVITDSLVLTLAAWPGRTRE